MPAINFILKAVEKIPTTVLFLARVQALIERRFHVTFPSIRNIFQFLREELKYDSGYEKRQRAFHRNDDMHISVRELWEAWLKSEVHNWTVEQTSEWLSVNVDLPQYKPIFLQHRVTGATLPRYGTKGVYDTVNNVSSPTGSLLTTCST